MTLTEYGAIAEVVGVLGMIASLVYVGYQLQQARVQMRGAAAQARTDSLISIYNNRLAASDYSELMEKSRTDPDAITATEREHLGITFFTQFQLLANSLYQLKLGLLEEQETPNLYRLPYFNHPAVRQYWNQVKDSGFWSAEFTNHVDEVLAKNDAME
jgi:ABC-type phosphate transport system auxiliary subunit